jgi:hypothetical protein
LATIEVHLIRRRAAMESLLLGTSPLTVLVGLGGLLYGSRPQSRTPHPLASKEGSTMRQAVLCLFLLVGLLVASVPQGIALTISTDNPVGNLLLVSPPSAPEVPSSPSGWHDVPGLSTAVYSRAGDSLEITVTAEIVAPVSAWLRALVDGTAAAPDDVVYKLAGDFYDGVRSFTFVKQNVSAGRHVVQIQWLAATGTTAQIGDRTLSVNSAARVDRGYTEAVR